MLTYIDFNPSNLTLAACPGYEKALGEPNETHLFFSSQAQTSFRETKNTDQRGGRDVHHSARGMRIAAKHVWVHLLSGLNYEMGINICCLNGSDKH